MQRAVSIVPPIEQRNQMFNAFCDYAGLKDGDSFSMLDYFNWQDERYQEIYQDKEQDHD